MVEWTGYLIFGKQRAYPYLKARLTKSETTLNVGEISVKLSAELPDALFKRPMLEAKIDIPEELIPSSIIDVNIQNNIVEAVKEATGVNIAFTIEEQKKDENETIE